MKRGRLAQRVAAMPPSGIRRFFDIAATMPEVISLGIGEPDFDTPPSIVGAAQQALAAGATHYTPNAGLPELRQALAEHLAQRHGVHYDPETEILITVGVSEALYLAVTAVLDPGDQVIVPTPCFVSYRPEVVLAGGEPIPLPLRAEDDFAPAPQALEAAITPRTKALLLNYPHNPTGALPTQDALVAVAQVAARHDLVVISDEIYDQLTYGRPHVCFAALPEMRERTLLLGGFSKSYAMTGWRIGYVAGPRDLMEGLAKIHQYTIMCAPTLAQHAALAALQQGAEAVAAMRAEYDRRRRLMLEGLRNIGLPTVEPHRAFYLFPEVRGLGLDDETFAWRLLEEEQVAVVPGSAFGPGGEGFVRCSYATAYEKLEQALERMAHFVQRRRAV